MQAQTTRRSCDHCLGVALILGSEGQGLSDVTLASCRRVSIPMQRMESLNVASAGSILMWAVRPAQERLLQHMGC